MTDNEIIEALSNDVNLERHYIVHIDKEEKASCTLLSDLYNLIISQKTEIDELTAEVDKQYEQAKAERAEAVKEFAERLKDSLDDFYHTEEDALLETGDLIDNLVKEMSGDEA